MKNRVCIQHSLSIFISEISLFTTVSFNNFLKMRIESQENLLYVIDKVSYFYLSKRFKTAKELGLEL